MSTKRLYLLYFIIGSANAIAIQMLPLILTEKSFDANQVTMALSVVFLAALFQPVIGYLTKSKFGSKRMIQFLLTVMAIMTLVIFATTKFIPMLFIVLLLSIARTSISPIYDSYTTMAATTHGVNYGLIRSGASLGFGTGMAIYTIIANIFGFGNSASFVFASILLMIGLVIIAALPHEDTKQQLQSIGSEQSSLIMSVLLISMFMLYFGALNIRLSYLSMYYIEFGYSNSFISLTTFFMVIPEIIFLPLYNRFFAKYNKVLLLCISLIIGILQILMYIAFTNSPGLLLFGSLFNGFQIMIFFPTYFGLLQKSLGPKNSSFGFIMNMTMMSIFVGVFNTVVIRPIYVAANSTIPIFWLIICLQIAAFVPLLVYNFKNSVK
ncbi:MFS transporter [Mollicutes bacterium LVI A0039]|nr:MFS transporter [Mollicutes bacterium LVI A0039]